LLTLCEDSTALLGPSPSTPSTLSDQKTSLASPWQQLLMFSDLKARHCAI